MRLSESVSIGKKDKQTMLRECLEGSMHLTRIIKKQLQVLRENGINQILANDKE